MNQIDDGSSRRHHRRVAELLPWYVNGSLEGGDLEEVTRHLGACPTCRADAEEQQRLARLLRTSEELAYSAERGLERMRELLHGEVPAGLRSDVAAGSSGDGAKSWLDVFRGLPIPVRWALAAQLLLVVALGTALLRPRAPARGFTTLTEPTAAVAGEGLQLRVVFAETTPEGEVRQLLDGLDAQIAAGPTPFGVYTLVLPASADVERVLQSLRASDRVIFAEPVGGGANSGRPADGAGNEDSRHEN